MDHEQPLEKDRCLLSLSVVLYVEGECCPLGGFANIITK